MENNPNKKLALTKELKKTVLYQSSNQFNGGPGDIYAVDALRSCSIMDYVRIIFDMIG
jgi:hypothetical protein